MAFKIGFAAEHPENKPAGVTYTAQQMQAAPRKSVVQVYFAAINKGTLFAFAIDGKDTGSFTL